MYTLDYKLISWKQATCNLTSSIAKLCVIKFQGVHTTLPLDNYTEHVSIF